MVETLYHPLLFRRNHSRKRIHYPGRISCSPRYTEQLLRAERYPYKSFCRMQRSGFSPARRPSAKTTGGSGKQLTSILCLSVSARPSRLWTTIYSISDYTWPFSCSGNVTITEVPSRLSNLNVPSTCLASSSISIIPIPVPD